MTARKKAAALPKPPAADPDSFVLPHNLEAERATLGAAMLSEAAADYIVDNLTVEAYFRRAHQTLYQCMRDLREDRSAVDFLTLKQKLTARKKLEDVGGASYLSGLIDGIPRSTNVAHYAGILKDLHVKRALAGFATRTIDYIAAGAHSAEALLVDTDRRLLELQGGHVEGRMRSLAASAGELYEDLNWRVDHKGELTGVDTGFPSINELTLGWQGGDLIIVAARPSIGKTSFVMNSAVRAARTTRRDGTPRRIAVFSFEMRRKQLEYRMLAEISGVPLSRLLGGHLAERDYGRISAALSEMSSLQISIDDRAGQGAWEVRATCRRMKAEAEGLDAVILDYIQLMPGSLDRKGASRNDEITDISRRMKDLADEISAPVIALSQLTRDNEKRADPRPKLSDLRESGALEQDADIVGFLHRKNHRESGLTEFILEKQRNGATGTVNLTFDRDTTTFTDAGIDLSQPTLSEEPPETSRPHRRRAS